MIPRRWLRVRDKKTLIISEFGKEVWLKQSFLSVVMENTACMFAAASSQASRERSVSREHVAKTDDAKLVGAWRKSSLTESTPFTIRDSSIAVASKASSDGGLRQSKLKFQASKFNVT